MSEVRKRLPWASGMSGRWRPSSTPSWMGRMENANGLLDTLHRDHGYQPTGAFGDLAEGRQLTRAGDSIRFHDQARRAGATHWFLHQGGEWQGGRGETPRRTIPWRPGGTTSRPPSAATASFRAASDSSEDEAGLRRHCILGVLVELFRDDYPTALNLLTSPEGGPNGLRRTRQERDLPDQPAAGGAESGGADHLPGRPSGPISHGVSSDPGTPLWRHRRADRQQPSPAGT